MEKLIDGVWGCFFGMAVVILLGALVAYLHSLRRIAFNAALTALVPTFYVAVFFWGIGLDDADRLVRFLAFLTTLNAGFFNYQFLMTLSMLKTRGSKQRVLVVLALMCFGMFFLVLVLSPRQALVVSSAYSGLLGACALALGIRSAIRGERLAWTAVSSVFFNLIALFTLTWIALERGNTLPFVQMTAAIASTLYLAFLAYFMWRRYSNLIELHQVMAYGPGYDPVTRMCSHVETGQMVGNIFKNFRDKPSPMGVVVLTIGNLHTLQELHGISACNNAFYICAERLRHWVPRQVKMGRLGDDGFLLITQDCLESKQVIDMARALELQLRRSVKLNAGRDASLNGVADKVWVAEIGMGVLYVSNPRSRGSDAIAIGRRMARTAISYASRIAWFDYSSGEITELPALKART